MLPVMLRLAIFLALLLSSLLFIWSFYTPRLEASARHLILAAFLLETAELAHQAVLVHGFPAVTLAGFLSFLVWMVAGAFLLFAGRATWTPVGGFVVPLLTVIWLVGQLASPTVDGRLPGALSGGWLAIHVALATASYAAFILSAGAALMYLEKERELKRKTPRVFYYRLPALVESDTWSRRLVILGLPLLTATMATGAIWSKTVTGAYWSWSAKETWSLVTWAVYAAYLGLRWRGWSGHRAAWLSVMAFLAVVANFFGITLIFHGWHDYGG
jgi:cytochrome c-type biogenesis protein CcsB